MSLFHFEAEKVCLSCTEALSTDILRKVTRMPRNFAKHLSWFQFNNVVVVVFLSLMIRNLIISNVIQLYIKRSYLPPRKQNLSELHTIEPNNFRQRASPNSCIDSTICPKEFCPFIYRTIHHTRDQASLKYGIRQENTFEIYNFWHLCK